MTENRVPRTIWFVIALWATMLGLQLTQDLRGSDGSYDMFETGLSLGWVALMTGLVAAALISRSRLGWAAVVLAHLHWAATGVYNLAINDYPFDWILELRQIPFYFGGLPVVVGIVNITLLSLPSTRRWCFRRGVDSQVFTN